MHPEKKDWVMFSETTPSIEWHDEQEYSVQASGSTDWLDTSVLN